MGLSLRVWAWVAWLCGCGHAQVWTRDGVRDGVWHTCNQEKRVWEVMRDTAIHSYNIMLNKKYKVGDAMVDKTRPGEKEVGRVSS